MKIVIDTNVVVSALFFGGKPLEIIRLLLKKQIEVTASPEIIKEYLETTDYLLNKYQGQDIRLPLMQIITNINIIADSNDVQI